LQACYDRDSDYEKESAYKENKWWMIGVKTGPDIPHSFIPRPLSEHFKMWFDIPPDSNVPTIPKEKNIANKKEKEEETLNKFCIQYNRILQIIHTGVV